MRELYFLKEVTIYFQALIVPTFKGANVERVFANKNKVV